MLQRWADPNLAAKLLKKSLVSAGLFRDFMRDLRSPDKVAAPVELPGFDLFSQSGAISPYLWCVPKPKGDTMDAYSVYEEYVDRPLGSIRNPKAVAGTLLRGSSARRAYFGTSERCGDWYLPLVKLLAMLQHLEDTPILRKGDVWCVHLGVGYLEVTPSGCWSNFRGGSIAAKPAQDACLSGYSVPALRSRHPLALAAMKASEEGDYGVLWAANTMLRAQAAKRVDSRFCLDAFGAPRPALDAADAKAVREALRCCELTLKDCEEGLIGEVFRLAVPTLCTVAFFKSHFCNPYGAQTRSLRPQTREMWLEKLRELAGRA